MARRSNTEALLPLHPLAFRVLLTLLEGPSYATRIVEEIERQERGRTRIYPANLFRRIRDLLSRNLVEECTSPEGADPRRNYLRLTAAGRAVARAEAQRMSKLVAEAARHGLLPGE